ncbi:acetyltransferase [Undibacterium sp. Di27W]|uniref:acetyltransferase n=1 Tax=Undibacterium sp. Di27W TaxID=3413036 RepID=UPI003BF24DAC
MNKNKLVIFGSSNILSDLFDCALANGLVVSRIVLHLPEAPGERDLSLAQRLDIWASYGPVPEVVELADFQPAQDELYLLGPTTPTRQVLEQEILQRFPAHGLEFHTLIHPRAYVSPMAKLAAGVFVGANSVISPGAVLGRHVFVNRGVTIGHDTHIDAFSRVQPGSNVGGLSRIGHSVTIAIGATLTERLRIGDHAFIGAGAVVISDVETGALMVGNPARFKKSVLPSSD